MTLNTAQARISAVQFTDIMLETKNDQLSLMQRGKAVYPGEFWLEGEMFTRFKDSKIISV